MTNTLKKLLLAGALLAVASPMAFADPVDGSISVSGTDTWTSSGITFNPGTGVVLQGTGTMSNFTLGTPVSLQSFQFNSSAIGAVIISATNAIGQLVTFTLTSIPTIVSNTATFLNITGTGTFAETNYSSVTGTFSLTSTVNGITSFTFDGTVPALTPEPSSLLLLGTGLLGAATLVMRRRKLAA